MSATTENRPRFSPAIRVPVGTGDLLYLSGVICRDEDARDNIDVQTRRVFARIVEVLKQNGASLTNVVKTTTFLADLADYPVFNQIRIETFLECKDPPASSAVGAALLGTGTRVEIELVAFVPSQKA